MFICEFSITIILTIIIIIAVSSLDLPVYDYLLSRKS